MTDLSGKLALVVGVANKRSISWAIAQALATLGRPPRADVSERAPRGKRARAGGDARQSRSSCRAMSRTTIRLPSSADRSTSEFGGLDFFVHGAAFAKSEDLAAPFSQTSREGFRIALDVSAYSFIALAREMRPLMQKRGGGSMLTLTYLGSERVFKNYNVMGVAKAALESSVRYLAAELGPENIRVNAISAGPIKTLAAMGISGFSSILGHYREHAPLQKNTELAEVADAALFLLGPAGRGVTAEIMMVDAGFSVMGF